MTSDVTVGIPVYNGAATLRRTVESVISQSFPVATIIISDNCSTDDTAQVTAALSAEYPSVRVFRQDTNLGYLGNFKFVLQNGSTQYFMWLAADDTIADTYVEKTRAVLEQDPGLSTCVSRVLFTSSSGETRLGNGSYPLLSNPATNLAVYFSHPSDNSRVFGLHRRGILLKSFPKANFTIAYDWALMAATLIYGRHAEVPETLMFRDETPWESYIQAIRRHARWRIDRVLPLRPMTMNILGQHKVPLSAKVVKALLYANLTQHFDYARVFHPRYAKVAPWMDRHLLWRLRTE